MTQNIPATPEARKQWLLDKNNRDPIARGGAGSIYYFSKETPDDLKIIVSTRAKAAGQGLAHFGGLSEESDTVKGDPLQTGIHNACREGREEMAELLGHEPDLDITRYRHLYTAHDDAFFINNGHGFAVNARLHAYKADPALVEALFPNGSQKRMRDENHKGAVETAHAEIIGFKDALKRQDDYFYAHEYFALWVMASKVMQWDVMALVEQVNKDMSGARIDFNAVAARMHTDLATLESYLGVPYRGKLQAYEAGHNGSAAKRKPHNLYKR